jgi:hypothetical protein
VTTEREKRRTAALELIRSNIEKSGYHVYLVAQRVVPRFAYTIGLSRRVGAEIVLAGAIYYMAEEVLSIISAAADALEADRARRDFAIDGLGRFSLRDAHESWTGTMMIGALDYYNETMIRGLQVVPDADHWTRDIPDLGRPRSPDAEPVWQWLSVDWGYPVPAESTAVTNLAALRGEPIKEAARWEEGQWEMFTGPGTDFPKSEIRIVPLGTLLALDHQLVPVTELEIGEGILRDNADDPWREWQ